MISIVLAFVVCAKAQNPVVNGDFADGLSGWTASSASVVVEAVKEGGEPSAHLAVSADKQPGYPSLTQYIDAKPGDVLHAEVDAMGRNVQRGVGAYMTVEFSDTAGKRMVFAQSQQAHPLNDWMHLDVETIVPAGAVKAQLRLVLNGLGDAYFKHVRLERTVAAPVEPLHGPVTLTVTNRIACKDITGFGAEDDGWFYNPINASHGVTEADYALREERIRWMDPDWIRMFCWYEDWNPSGDWETFDFDTPNMQSHYRTLDLYQKIGASVDVVGVEWGAKDPYGNPKRAAQALGALLEHLIRDKGYTCIRNWTLTNEPNGYFVNSGYTFERFRQMHVLVKREIKRRGLNVHIVGSDDTNGGFYWFKQCATNKEYFETADSFSTHRYLNTGELPLADQFFQDRLDLLRERFPHKPLMVTEFGFQDSRTSGAMHNPVMDDYSYAMWTMKFVIGGLNRGVAGYSIWCMNEMYYPGNGFMEYGLWGYKDTNWKPRPVYYAWAPLCLFTEPGDKARVCVSSAPAYVSAAMVGNTLFWVNEADVPVVVQIKGKNFPSVRALTENTISGDRESGTEIQVRKNQFSAPAKSFGYGHRQ